MQKNGAAIVFSAGDLVGHLNCRYLTHLDLKVAKGELVKPRLRDDPALDALVERGKTHEQGFVDHLAKQGGSVAIIAGVGIDDTSVAQTRQAMARGDAVIVQAALQDGHWSGRADVLQRVETPSGLGVWSYEVTDTKLARQTKGNTVLQLSLYSHLLATMQQRVPEMAHVVTPGTEYLPEAYRVADFAAIYRRIKRSLETFAAAPPHDGLYPDPIEHCEVCRWREPCASRRRDDDHLSLVAGIAKTQIEELVRRGVCTMAALATLPIPLQWRPDRGTAPSYEKVREQARLQVEGRGAGQLIHEVLPLVAGFGLFRLPEPSAGDLFFDFEGDPFVDGGGLEFLFGYLYADEDGTEVYVGDWVTTRQHERAAFERFIDFVTERLTTNPRLHIYHFAPYEPAALKRLMGRYATREDEVDNLLRAGVFVDLYAIVRQSIRASVESYSIKKLEPLYGFERTVPLLDVGGAMARVQACLELADAAGIAVADQAAIAGYNRDDCASTRALRDWLEGVRDGLIAQGKTIDRPQPKPAEISEDLSAWKRRVAGLVARLTSDVPDDLGERSPEQQARWLLAHLIDFFGRENKAVWWEYFRLSELSAEDLLHERAGLGGLTFLSHVGGTAKAPIHRYNFTIQETDVRSDDELKSVGGDKLGSVVAISNDDRTIDIKKRKDTAGFHPEAVFAHKFVDNLVLAESIFRIGEHVADHGILGPGAYRAARDLLLKVAPRLRGQPLEQAGEPSLAAAMRAVRSLDQSVFPVQGPPGTGKTHAGARMICALVCDKRTVGVTANSHKVIRHLLNKSLEAAGEQKMGIQCIQKVSDEPASLPGLRLTTKNPDFIVGLANGCQVGGATGWFWARPDAAGIVDVLFVDEAAQMSLANVLAVSQAAESIVLLGDPRQLEQPIQGSHPDGVATSALDHVLGEHATIEAGRGLFLEETWRLHPEICAFTSELFYEGRLRSRAGLERHEIRSAGRVRGAGLRYLAVQHVGNQNSSPEEANEIKRLVDEILSSKASWLNNAGTETAIRLEDILIIAPYNAQVFELQDRLPSARIGTVDKFQGQEAPIVIYSMTTSSHSDAPRGMEFLYSLNRLNVATSRAKCLCILVASPRVFEAECRTPRQMQLANAFCRYFEMASPL
ncbi:TM0106 family RecB-like putative nuclease [Bradyrhizobium ottawaense]|uniref:TM0106 family RecB-like putative nuclease n=1 Tax=Bradyrhizobium ottawaense TaxID=931866 RepID=UPI001BADC2AD|nr:TM0106 family RecB-like putative nuclease [Bradyrhizobium ottawaense]MBR1329877.1 TM0106 family RecB-like putative nuclease [Bradyrhizobium ottawaense]